MTRRIWIERLPAEELRNPATVALLRRFELEPLVALPPSAETATMAAALRALAESGLRVGLWPLLSEAQGYWPSTHNAHDFTVRVDESLAFARAAGIEVRTIAVDLEPHLSTVRSFFGGRRWAALHRAAKEAITAGTARRDGQLALRRLSADLKNRGIETLAAVLPLVMLDLVSPLPIWQRLLGTPLESWDVVTPMLYTSMIREELPFLSERATRGLIALTARGLQSKLPDARASLSLGVVGHGKLDNEACLESPKALQRDVDAAREAGIEDLALHSLEGVLERSQPERWLQAFVRGARTSCSTLRR